MLGRFHSMVAVYRSLVARRVGLVVLVFLLSFLSALFEGVGLSIVYPILASMTGGLDTNKSIWKALAWVAHRISSGSIIEGLMLIAVVLFLVKAVLATTSTAVLSLLIGRLREDWSTAVFRQYLCGPINDVIVDRPGRIVQRAKQEPNRAAKSFEAIMALATRTIFAVVLVTTLFVLNWRLMLAMVVVIGIASVLVRRYMFRPMRKLGKAQLKLDQTATAAVAEPVFGAMVVKLLGVEDVFVRRLKDTLRRLTKNNMLSSVYSKAPSDFVEFFIVLAVAAMLFVSVRGLGLSYQEVVPLIGSFAVVSARLLSVMTGLLGKRLIIENSIPSLMLVHGIVSKGTVREAAPGGATLTRIEQDIEFRGVSFAYGDKPVFDRLSLTLPRGKTIGIIGPSGVGKSTLGYLLARLYEPGEGAVLVNGRDIREYSLASLRRRIGYVEQTPVIFNGTVTDNIRLGAPDATMEQVIEAAKAAGVHDFVMAQPGGYDGNVSDQGTTQSGGERQRIAIARAIVRKPDVYIFDEATNALDRHTEAQVQEAIGALSKEATVILIAHRLSTLKDADLILELSPGGQVAVRTFNELAA
jgi:subfamily B ATP-binding cassette protein MsbA